MKIDSSVYNYLSTSLVPQKRETTHKSSELKAVSNTITKYNQKSPLYIISGNNQNQERMINIKEAALSLIDTVNNFSDSDSEVYSKKDFSSSNPDYVSGSIKKQNPSAIPDKLIISVDSLANEQINIGNYLESEGLSIPSGEYRFSITNQNKTANFAVSVGENDTNIELQISLSDFINQRGMGIMSSVIQEGKNSAIVLSSEATGVPATYDKLYFTVNDMEDYGNLSSILGLNNVSTYPKNSEFSINNEKHVSTTNNISINQAVEIDFHKPTSTPVEINFTPDTSYAIKQIDMFIDSYNKLVDLGYAANNKFGSRSLLNDISKITKPHKAEFESVGLTFNETGHMEKNEEAITASIKKGTLFDTFDSSSNLMKDVVNSTNRLILDPAAYINKIMVTYPNTNSNNQEAYKNSVYSGLIYNNYA